MRDNGPITQRNREVPANSYLVSRTDPKGVITYANNAFVAISGFTYDELLGQPHNMVRHPDMPAAAFADLWATLQAGKGWVGVVKNRSKNGDHYWVRAAVSPELGTNGTITGFVSVRSLPSATEIAVAEAAYKEINAGKRQLMIVAGRIRRRGLLAAIGRGMTSLRMQISLTFVILIGLVGATAWSGLSGMRGGKEELQYIYDNDFACTLQLSTVERLTRSNWGLLGSVVLDTDPQAALAQVETNQTNIQTSLTSYLATAQTPAEKILSDRFVSERDLFMSRVMNPAKECIQKKDKVALRALLTPENTEIFNKMAQTIAGLINIQDTNSQELIADSQAAFREKSWLTCVLGASSVLVAIGAGILLSRRLLNGLQQIHGQLEGIANGRLDTTLNLDRHDEFGSVQVSMAVLQTRLNYVELRDRESRKKLIESFDRSLGAVLNDLDVRINELQKTAQAQGTVAAQVANNAHSVSSATTELSASIREISNQAASASQLASLCAERTTSGVAAMQRLAKAGGEISGVAKVIGRIADQTNLLALNATIEAASAGAAGKGFTVVASEVKSLATQTSSATGDIGKRIAVVIADTSASNQALQAIAESVERLNSAATSIAAAVEEQTAVVDEVARGANDSSAAATATGDAAQAVALAATALAEGSKALSKAAADFKAGLGS